MTKRDNLTPEQEELISQATNLGMDILDMFDGKSLGAIIGACARALSIAIYESDQDVDELMEMFNGSFNASMGDLRSGGVENNISLN